jgi:para-nitrobenzyl esterase
MKCFVTALALILALPTLAQTIEVESGQLDGKILDSGVRAWLGIPFAAPPLRELRWKAPQPAANWAGVYRADRFAPMCLQPLRYRTMNHYFGNEATSEDCLYLNIWAPKLAEKLPVVVWIYGGGFNIGSASMANYAGEHLAAKGVIQVNLAYRVGALGFLSHPDLSKEGNGASGNYGLMDQIAGLEWIKRNIAAFGGDPGNVTIMGQSAGAMSVALLQSSPAAKGLFHRVIGMSGSPFADLMAPVPLAQAEGDGVKFQASFKAANIEALRDIGGDRIVAMAFPRQSAITLDGKVLSLSPSESFKQNTHSDVPVMLGYTQDESFRSLGIVNSVADFQAAIFKAFPANAKAILAAYPVKDGVSVARAVADVQRDSSLGLQMAGWARAQKSPTYVWLFSRRQPYAAGVAFSDHDTASAGAYHSGDVPYWLKTLDSFNLFRTTRDWTSQDRALAERMSDMIIAFARTDVPAATWPKFNATKPKMLMLGEVARLIDWPGYKALDLFKFASPASLAASSRPRD